MEVIIKPLTDVSLVRRACEMTMHGQASNVTLADMYKAEHSPVRCVLFWIELRGIPSFVSTHLVRHKHGVEHFVQSMRDDLYIGKDTEVGRETPVNHGMLINAQAVIAISRKRMCLKAHLETRRVWSRVRSEMRKLDSALADRMVPECVYRNEYCPELRSCAAGPAKVCESYRMVYANKEFLNRAF